MNGRRVTSPDREASATRGHSYGRGLVTGRRRRIAARTRLDFWFDAVLLVGFTLAYSYSFTGIGIHEWLGIGLGAALLLHLALLVAMTFCVASGILISRVALPFLGMYPLTGPFWTQLHFRTADITLALGWNHIAGGTVGAVRQGRDARILIVGPPAGAARGTRPGPAHGPVIIQSQPMDLGLNSMLDPANLPSLRHAVVIEAGAAAAVVITDLIRRRWRRARRTGS